MPLDEKISRIRALIAQRDDIDRQIAAAFGDAVLSIPAVEQRKGKRRGPQISERDLTDEANEKHGRSRLDPAVKQEIEHRLISGESVAVILENVEVSAPTVYVIKSRLKSEGRLL